MSTVCPCCGRPMVDTRDPAEYGRRLRLSRYQRKILDRLVQSFGQWVPSAALVTVLYGNDPNGGPDDATMAVSALISDLRKKLTDTDLWIETSPGRGNGDRRLLWRQQKLVKALLTEPMNNGASLLQEARH